jgi:hypothetical protein
LLVLVLVLREPDCAPAAEPERDCDCAEDGAPVAVALAAGDSVTTGAGAGVCAGAGAQFCGFDGVHGAAVALAFMLMPDSEARTEMAMMLRFMVMLVQLKWLLRLRWRGRMSRSETFRWRRSWASSQGRGQETCRRSWVGMTCTGSSSDP